MRSGACPKTPGLTTRAAGHLCVTVLRVLRRLPLPFTESILRPLLAAYPLFRPSHARRLQELFDSSPHSNRLEIRAYYRMRLGLLLRNVRLHGNPIPLRSVKVTGLEIYRRALENSRPVVLLGLHAGVLELLHKVPEAPIGRPFLILTAPAFAPALSAFMAQGRERGGKRVVWNRNPAGVAGLPGCEFSAGLRSILKSNGVLALMADQIPSLVVDRIPDPDAGLITGPKTGSDLGSEPIPEPLVLWDRIQLPYPARLLGFLAGKGFLIVPVSTTLESDGVSAFRFHQAWDPLTKDEHGIRSHTQAHLEAGIAAAPEQWNWSYPKIRLSGSPPATFPHHRRASGTP